MEITELINGEIKILLKIYYSTHQIKKIKKKKKKKKKKKQQQQQQQQD